MLARYKITNMRWWNRKKSNKRSSKILCFCHHCKSPISYYNTTPRHRHIHRLF